MAGQRDLPAYAQRANRQHKAERAKAELARRSFAAFFRQQWHVSKGSEALEWTPFLEGICDEIQFLLEGWLVANGRGNRRQRERVIATWSRLGLSYEEGCMLVQNEIFNLAPGTLKSSIIMVAAPAWMWLHDPTVEFGCTSSNEDNVKRDSNAHKELVTSKWYRRTFNIAWGIKGKADAVQHWETTAGGLRLSRSWLQGFTGIHVDIILMDDADDARKVWQDPVRKETHNQYTTAMENRIRHERRSLRINLQQRVHVDDQSGYLRSLAKWSPESAKTRMGWALFAIATRAGFGPKDFTESPFGWRDPRAIVGATAIAHAIAHDQKVWRYPGDGEPGSADVPLGAARDLAVVRPHLVFTPHMGEFMQPSRFGQLELEDKLTKLGSYGVSAQYDQVAERVDGGIFPRRLWKFWRAHPEARWGTADGYPPVMPSDDRVRRPAGFLSEEDAPAYVIEHDPKTRVIKLDWLTCSVDATFGSLDPKTASAVGLKIIGGLGLRRFIFHDATKMRSFPDACSSIKGLALRFPFRRVLIETKANGPAIISTLANEVADAKVIGPNGKPLILVVEGFEPGSDTKAGRANAMLPAVEAGLWYVPEGAPWIEEWAGEVCVFPEARRNDRVDAMTQVATYYSDHDDELNNALALAKW